MKILITGGAGFIGSNLSVLLKKKDTNRTISVIDNLKRRGAELNLPRLKQNGIEFVHGDIRNPEDLNFSKLDLLIECSAEPSVLSGTSGSPDYLVNTNLMGTYHCLELCRKTGASILFLSTSRVYPIELLNRIQLKETNSRLVLDFQNLPIGITSQGITEDFPLHGYRSLYGATKLASELLLVEYIQNFGIRGVVNRCGVITGPWQMGKIDQGVIVLWLAKHFSKKRLSYIGYGGEGKQVRDFLDIADLFSLVEIQIRNLDKINGEVFNIGGGNERSISLKELTEISEELTGNRIEIRKEKENRPGDIPWYITDSRKAEKILGWKPEKPKVQTFQEIFDWLRSDWEQLKNILE